MSVWGNPLASPTLSPIRLNKTCMRTPPTRRRDKYESQPTVTGGDAIYMKKYCLVCDKEITDTTRFKYCSGKCKAEHDTVVKNLKRKDKRRKLSQAV